MFIKYLEFIDQSQDIINRELELVIKKIENDGTLKIKDIEHRASIFVTQGEPTTMTTFIIKHY